MKLNKQQYNQKYKPIQNILTSRPKSSDRNDILEWLQYIGLVDNYIKKLEYSDIDPETLKDEIQEIWLYICELDQETWDELYYQGATAIKAYISGIIYKAIHSNSSLIWFKYKKPYNYFKHISDKAWDIFDETDTMETTQDYSIKETELDIIKRNIENNNEDIYEEKTWKT